MSLALITIKEEVFATFLFVVAAGCAGRPALPVMDLTQPAPEQAPQIAPGDVVEVKFIGAPELNESQAVSVDGKLCLQLVGHVSAAGKTVGQLREDLVQIYTPHLKKPDISVIIRSHESRRVSVLGEVFRPGPVAMPAQLTLLDALTYAGGHRPDTAELANVVIIRREGNKAIVGTVDVRPSLGLTSPKEDEAVQPLYLRPGDVVYVPETRIVRIDRWIDQHINRLIPVTGLVVSTRTGTTDIGYDTAP